ncbi:MAG: SpoIID/LytB domain-containing protein [Candidatus Caenarcaniphilales bacterium]|nr:SpoIID/LytB domain-containing protein [Candidatus Caenarcaniphilales bacterium]
MYLTFLMALLVSGGAFAKVKIKLLSSIPSIRSLRVKSSFELIYPTERHFQADLYEFKCVGRKVSLYRTKKSILSASRLRFKSESLELQEQNRIYTGDFDLSCATSEKLQIFNTVDPRVYLESVVGSESDPDTPFEALKAQAVLSYTWYLSHRDRPYFSDSTQDQSYRGEAYRRPLVRQAVREVWGERLIYKGDLARVYYHSDCGGQTSNLKAFEPKAISPSYLRSQTCPASAHRKKSAKLSLAQWYRLFESENLPNLILVDQAGRPLLWKFEDDRQISGYLLWLKVGQTLGWHLLPGNHYRIWRDGESIIFFSKGVGHGVGLCQKGSQELAARGKDYKEILQFYFPGTEVKGSP